VQIANRCAPWKIAKLITDWLILRISLYSRGTDHTENAASIVETCLPNHRIATVATRTPLKTISLLLRNRYYDMCLSVCYLETGCIIPLFHCRCVYYCDSTVLACGKYATTHTLRTHIHTYIHTYIHTRIYEHVIEVTLCSCVREIPVQFWAG
jgi:hypothetical protein